MQNKIKLILMTVIGLASVFLGFTNVSAATLVEDKIPDVWYTRRGGGKPYMSAQYTTYTMDGKVVYCIEPGAPITTHNYVGAEGWVNSPYSQEVNQKIQLIGYYGYDYPGHNTIRYRMAAQALIWTETGGQIIEYWTEASGWGDYINVDYEKGEIMKLVNAHYNKPSFNGEKQTTVIGQTVTFTDNSGVLDNYKIYKSDNATASINGNTLSVTPTGVGEIEVILQRKTYNDDPSQVFVGFDVESQKMGYFRIDDPIRAAVYLTSYGGTVTLEKLDSKTMSFKPVGDAKLNGATYGIYNEYDVRVGGITTNGSSMVKSDYLPSLGKFYLKEEISSEGYELDPTKYYFELTPENLNQKITVYENVIERDVEIYKVYANGTTTILTSEPNIEFEFYLKSSGELYTSGITNQKGKLEVKLSYGTFLVKQKNSTPNFEKVDDFEITIENSSNDPLTKIISNSEITSKLKLVKIDEESKRVLVRDGIKFKIKNLDTNEYVCQNITYPTQQTICTFETTDGMFVTPYVLNSGNYQIEELEEQVIEGYVWNSNPLKFSITENSNFIYDKDFGVMLEVKFTNKQVKGEVEVNKIGEKMVIENNDFHYEEVKLNDVPYNLIADGDIYSQDGTLIYNDKDVVSTFKTNNGFYKLTNLYLGKYCLIETETNESHVLNSEPYCFELKYKDQYTDTIKMSITLKNYLKKNDFKLTKTDLSTGEPVEGALITISTLDDEVIYSGYTDSNGEILVKSIGYGKYKFSESEAPEGYILNEETHYFEVLEDGEIIKDTLTNEMITGDFELTKLDIATGEPVEGALIEIFDSEGNLIYSGYTDHEGKILLEDLEYGEYSFKESEAPEGYILNDELHHFKIEKDGEIVKDTLSNEKEVIDVPNTLSNFDAIYIPIGIIAFGLILLIVSKKRRKK